MTDFKPNQAVIDHLIAEIERMQDKDTPKIGAGDKLYTPNDMLKEIKQQTERGKGFLKTYEQLQRKVLGEEEFNKKYHS